MWEHRKFRVPGVFSRDENYRRQNRIENTIWQCFEGFFENKVS
jgi:hypothetical protein